MRRVRLLGVAALLPGVLAGGCGEGRSGETAGPCDDASPIAALDMDTTGHDGLIQVYVLTADRRIERITGDWVATEPAFAPDGNRVVVVRADGDYESAGPESTALWTVGTDGSDPRQLTGDDDAAAPDWSPDGTSVVFTRTVLEGDAWRSSLATVPAGGGEPTVLLTIGDGIDHPVWSPDGRRIAFVRTAHPTAPGSPEAVWTIAADGTDARPLAPVTYPRSLDWHPDGTSLLAISDGQRAGAYLFDAATGEAELVGPRVHLATWSPDGESVYYLENRSHEAPSDWHLLVGHIDRGTHRLVADRELSPGNTDLGAATRLAIGPCG